MACVIFYGMIKNSNAEKFHYWYFRREDHLSSVAFFFVSKNNAINARYVPLFEKTKEIRIVYLSGWRLRYFDSLLMLLFFKLISLMTKKISRYDKIHIFNTKYRFDVKNQILHVDDPTYTDKELLDIHDWQNFNSKHGYKSILVCTNSFSSEWFQSKLNGIQIIIIEQGFHDFQLNDNSKPSKFSIVYTSPYIDFEGDKNSKHSTWGAHHLINELIPQISKMDPDIEIHLIGKLGSNAVMALSKYTNLTLYGRVDFLENIRILSTCTIGIYPRKIDHKRSILKIYTYLGAGLPIVTYDLIDTEVVKKNRLGFSVTDTNEFVSKVIELKNNPALLKEYKQRVKDFRAPYSWSNLAAKMELKISLI